MAPPLIELKGIRQFYRLQDAPPQQVLFDIDLTIEHGEFLAVMGHSGSGKSTLMNILGCMDVPAGGEYRLDGRDVARLSPDELAEVRNTRLGFVFQGFNLLKRMNVTDNIAMPLLYAGIGREQRQQRAMALLTQLQLDQYARHLPNQLSGGQQQRIAILRALVNNPPLLLADEPTGNLDSTTSHAIMDLFRQLNRERGITVVLVTHEHDIAAYARRVVRMQDGRIVEDRRQ